MKMKVLSKTRYAEQKEADEQKLYNKFKEMTAAGFAKTRARDALMKEFTIGSTATFYAALKRVENRSAHSHSPKLAKSTRIKSSNWKNKDFRRISDYSRRTFSLLTQ